MSKFQDKKHPRARPQTRLEFLSYTSLRRLRLIPFSRRAACKVSKALHPRLAIVSEFSAALISEYLNFDESWGSESSSSVSAPSIYSTPLTSTSDPLFSPSSPLLTPLSPYLYPPSPAVSLSPTLLSSGDENSFYSPASSTRSLEQEFSNTTLADDFGDRQGDEFMEMPLAGFSSNFDSRGN